ARSRPATPTRRTWRRTRTSSASARTRASRRSSPRRAGNSGGCENRRPLIGRTLAHYRITAAIGAGGMGEVYRATDTKLGRDVPLKTRPPETAVSAERKERFRREARAVAALNHPYIVTIHSVEEADGVHFLTMELVDGRALDAVLSESALPVERVATLGAAI